MSEVQLSHMQTTSALGSHSLHYADNLKISTSIYSFRYNPTVITRKATGIHFDGCHKLL